jgi:hydroxymethylglutaryl-CoA lyase
VNAINPNVIDKVSVFTAASETFAKKNTNASIAETLERFTPVVESAKASGLSIRGYVSTVIACPFEGPISPAAVANVAARLHDLGCDEIDLGDTIGAATPDTVRAVIDAVASGIGGTSQIVIHLHDTFGRAAECVKASIAAGVQSFDATVAGLGGCPYAGTPEKPAPGNIDMCTLLRAAREVGMKDTVHDAALARAAALAQSLVRTQLNTRAGTP